MERVTLFANVIVPLAVPNFYTYRVPQDLNDILQPGMRVIVQFGKSKFYTGIVHHIHHEAPKAYAAKYIEGVLDDRPVVTELQLKFWDWIAFYYCAYPGEVMNAALPSGLKLNSTSQVQLNPEFNFEETEHSFFNEREHQVIDALGATPTLTFDALAEALGLKSVQAIISRLLKKGAVQVYEDVKDRYKPKLQSFIKLSPEYQQEEKLGEMLTLLEKKAFKQAEALLAYMQLQRSSGELMEKAWIKKSDLLKKTENSAVAALVKKSVFVEGQFEVGRLHFEKSEKRIKDLSPAQETCYEEIKKGFAARKPVLLHGVTGSGKTEIYIKLIKEALDDGKETLMLIPEIALTTQLITRLRAAFGESVGVYHSRFSENERVEIWNNVLDGGTADEPGTDKKRYRVLLGARSCLLLPFTKLGLIIVDEEHDNSFKQHDPSPRYNARDAALFLATLHGANVLLGSGTPSIDSYYNATQAKYALAALQTQYVQSGGTAIEVCDVNYYSTSNQMRASMTPPLFNAVQEALNGKKQVILFQNRRGFAPYTECRQCGHVPHCVQCDVSLIYHKQQQKLVCHYCGYSVLPPKTCPACGGNQLHYKGLGTEKIEEEVEILFPKAKIARMDLDSTRSKYAYKQLIDDFESGAVDILIGTQMVTKGLDFGNVSVVGVLNADSILNFPDFRSFEKAYQLITQVRGRAGRSSEKGKVFVQTTQTEHKVIGHVKANDYKAFFAETLEDRRHYNYPPFTRLMKLNVISRDANELNYLANELLALLKEHFKAENLLGPEFPLISKIKNEYYKHILLKLPKTEGVVEVRRHIFTALDELRSRNKDLRYRTAIDVDPV
jgi:primosomal protein N' (replication factor Y) (superfamily II helicase)